LECGIKDPTRLHIDNDNCNHGKKIQKDRKKERKHRNIERKKIGRGEKCEFF
jgi:hypothetical protein